MILIRASSILVLFGSCRLVWLELRKSQEIKVKSASEKSQGSVAHRGSCKKEPSRKCKPTRKSQRKLKSSVRVRLARPVSIVFWACFLTGALCSTSRSDSGWTGRKLCVNFSPSELLISRKAAI